MPDSALLTERLFVRTTPDAYRRLEQVRIARGFESMADVARDALRAYLDEQEDQIGSRRHFSRSMAQRLDALERYLHLHSALNTYLLAQGMANLLRATDPSKAWSGSELLIEAARITAAQSSRLDAMIRRLLTEAEQSAGDA